jgi:hypothetical protein
MFPHTQFLKFAAAGAILALSAANHLHLAHADEMIQNMIQNLGPVGPNEPILATVGSKNVVAFYVPGSGTCGVQAVVWNGNDTDAVSAARIRINLNSGHTAHIDTAENKSISLQCGDHAETLAVVGTEERLASK